MKELYHICMAVHPEVLLRSVEDVMLTTNLCALSAWRLGAEILTDSQMSTHIHQIVQCENPEKLALAQRLSITKAFNNRHLRHGTLFEESVHISKLEGRRHIQMALAYSLRQGMHHGVCESPFQYEWGTCNQLFVSERGAQPKIPTYRGKDELRPFFPINSNFPDEWKTDENGILLRRCFEQLSIVENWFGTPKNFVMSMFRTTTEEWLAEQAKDKVNAPIINLQTIESGFSEEEIAQMLALERRTSFINKEKTDTEVCDLIDKQLLGKYSSIYQMPLSRRKQLFNELQHDFGIRNAAQLSRCLALKYNR